MRSSVTKYPPASWSTWPSTMPVFGLNPTKMKHAAHFQLARSPLTLSSSSR